MDQTLYARNSNGKINVWKIEVICATNDGPATIRIEEGLLGGTMTASERRVLKGKNIGKMNETSCYKQALSQAESRWNDKRKKGYKSLEDLGIYASTNATSSSKVFNVETQVEEFLEHAIDNRLPMVRTDANNLNKPMKAQPYFNDKGEVRIKFPCLGQPKLNGFRVMARLEKVTEGEGLLAQEVIKPTFRSKEGLRYTILEHIEEAVEHLINATSHVLNIPPKDIALDGEMYCEGLSLQEISSAVRKRNSHTPKLSFYIFDLAIEGVLQLKRANILGALRAEAVARNLNGVFIVQTMDILSDAEAQAMTDRWIELGYEGGIFRDLKAIYQFGSRPKTMVKLKRHEDKEFPIVDVVAGDNAPDLGIFVCRAENGNLFKVNPEGSHEVRREYLLNAESYRGKMLTVKFFERTKDGLPFHAVGVAVRDYE